MTSDAHATLQHIAAANGEQTTKPAAKCCATHKNGQPCRKDAAIDGLCRIHHRLASVAAKRAAE